MYFQKFLLIGLLAGLGLGSNLAVAQNQAQLPANLPPEARQAMAKVAFETHAAQLYQQAQLGKTGLSLTVFREALVGYYNLRPRTGKAPKVLTIVDFTRSSQNKRLWVLDVAHGKVLFHTLVAHGKSTGGDMARAFSNQNGSEQSSLGFYRTRNIYEGKHGLSLKIQGLDPGFNTNAESRSVVLHGADYVCEDFVRKHGRLGRSQGCPALPLTETSAIIKVIKGGSVMYLHGPAEANFRSKWLDVNTAIQAYAAQEGLLAGR